MFSLDTKENFTHVWILFTMQHYIVRKSSSSVLASNTVDGSRRCASSYIFCLLQSRLGLTPNFFVLLRSLSFSCPFPCHFGFHDLPFYPSFSSKPQSLLLVVFNSCLFLPTLPKPSSFVIISTHDISSSFFSKTTFPLLQDSSLCSCLSSMTLVHTIALTRCNSSTNAL